MKPLFVLEDWYLLGRNMKSMVKPTVDVSYGWIPATGETSASKEGQRLCVYVYRALWHEVLGKMSLVRWGELCVYLGTAEEHRGKLQLRVQECKALDHVRCRCGAFWALVPAEFHSQWEDGHWETNVRNALFGLRGKWLFSSHRDSLWHGGQDLGLKTDISGIK